MNCPECKNSDWKVLNPRGYSFVFKCSKCGHEFTMISLVDLQIRCKIADQEKSYVKKVSGPIARATRF